MSDRVEYSEAFDKQAHKFALLGATNRELADFFEVAERTIEIWLKKHPTFREAVKSGKLAADAEVAYKLYGRACGVTVTKQKVLSDGSVVSYKEELPPDTKAAETWLACRTKDGRGQWVAKQNVEVSGDKENPLAFILGEVAAQAENASPLPNGGDL